MWAGVDPGRTFKGLIAAGLRIEFVYYGLVREIWKPMEKIGVLGRYYAVLMRMNLF